MSSSYKNFPKKATRQRLFANRQHNAEVPAESALDESLGQARQGHDTPNSPGYELQAEHCAANYQ
jgi:hypothetical protein